MNPLNHLTITRDRKDNTEIYFDALLTQMEVCKTDERGFGKRGKKQSNFND